ncbi:protein kinase domain-containing protein [Actinomadura mexicana]|uniref:PQQ-like domain-containing protein n=1 Tax=Actinomadura mexicana TaxID=134959 RepID=A0A238UNB5_9ACTN|nr:PQQ-binding-like beta-propeller repeat protein [Actinomadura mexicana]SNR22993.1 PQQ-like domain-containing protein [Actinomadura mexicana]
MTAPPVPEDPDRIGRYRVLRRLGEGGMGRVYLGASPAGRAVAIKVVRPELAGDPEFRARFRAEVAAAQRVGGAFTSPVVDAEPDGAVPWLATAYVNGLSLKETVERYGPMPEPLLRTLGAGLGEALIAIHAAGLLHRDLKPANILLAKDGPRVIDFGISRAADRDASAHGPTRALTSEGQIIGSPGYMSPEQIRGGTLTASADVFAFGAVLAFAATGRPPFGRDELPAVIHRTLHEAPDLNGVPASLERMVAACLSRDPGERPPTGLLPSLLAAEPVAPGWLPGTLGEELRQREDTLLLDLREIAKARTRRRLLLGGAAAAGLAVIGGGTAAALAAAGGGAGRRPAPPKLLWRTTIDDLGDRAFSGEALSRTVVSHDERQFYRCHSLETGRRLWSGEFSVAATGPNLIYGVPEGGDRLIAIDESHKVRWTSDVGDVIANPELMGPDGGTLVLAGHNRTIIGVDAATGTRLWAHEWSSKTSIDFLYGITNRTLVAIGVQGTNSLLIGLDTATGALRWADPDGSLTVVPEGGGNLIFRNPSGVRLDALAADSGRRLWTALLPKAAAEPAREKQLSPGFTVAGGTVYTGSPTLYALDASTGRERWTYTPASPGGQERSFLVSGKYAYILDNPQLIALDARTGRRVWSVNTPATRPARLIAAGGMICLGVTGATGAGLYGWDAETGELVWNHPAPASAPTKRWALTTRDRTLVATQDKTLFAFRLS